VTSPPSSPLSESWVYLTNIDMGRGVSVQAAQDGSYSTQLEGQQGDQIIISVQAPGLETICRPLREGLANVAWPIAPARARRAADMGTLKGFAPPFGSPPATASPLASLGLAMPSHDGAPPATRAREARGGRGGLSVPKSPQGEPAGFPRD